MDRTALTRQRLQEQAVRLFSERGFDDVTVDEVARAAGVSHMTFFRHFPTKEAVVLDDPYDPVVGDAVARQDRDLPALERVRRGLLESWEGLDEPSDAMARARIELAASHPSLRARVWENNRRTEQIIVDALVGSGVDRLEASIAAGAFLGAITAAIFDWADHGDGEPLGDRVRRSMELLPPAIVTS